MGLFPAEVEPTALSDDHLEVLAGVAHKALLERAGSSSWESDLGLVLTIAELQRRRICGSSPDLIRQSFEALCAHARNRGIGPGLHNGLCGAIWLASWLRGSLELPADYFDEVEHALLCRIVERPLTPMRFDLLSGVTGVGVCALERVEDGARLARPLVAATVDSLVEPWVANGSLPWFYPFETLNAYERDETPNGCFDIGMAHGAAGVLAFLARAWRELALGDDVRGFVDMGVKWILSIRRSDRAVQFPARISASGEQFGGRALGWCYGDLGVSQGLLVAGMALGCSSTQEVSIEIARAVVEHATMERAEELSFDLCHGTAGIAEAFGRFALATGDQQFARAADQWRACTAAKLRMLLEVHSRPGDWDWSILSGVTGAALSLLGHRHEHGWDRLLLMSGMTMSGSGGGIS